MKQKGAEDIEGKDLENKNSYIGDDNPFESHDVSDHEEGNILPKNMCLVDKETPLVKCEEVKNAAPTSPESTSSIPPKHVTFSEDISVRISRR